MKLECLEIGIEPNDHMAIHICNQKIAFEIEPDAERSAKPGQHDSPLCFLVEESHRNNRYKSNTEYLVDQPHGSQAVL